MIGQYVKVERDGIPYVGSVIGESSGGSFDICVQREDGEKIYVRNLTQDDIIDKFDTELLMSHTDQMHKARDFFLKSNEDFNSQQDFFENYRKMAGSIMGSEDEENILTVLKIFMSGKFYKIQDLPLKHKDFEKTCLHLINFLSMMLILKEKSEDNG